MLHAYITWITGDSHAPCTQRHCPGWCMHGQLNFRLLPLFLFLPMLLTLSAPLTSLTLQPTKDTTDPPRPRHVTNPRSRHSHRQNHLPHRHRHPPTDLLTTPLANAAPSTPLCPMLQYSMPP